MSVTRVTSQMQHFEYLQCKCCNAVLPLAAVFCGQCGMRVDKDETYGREMLLSGQGNIAARYRITSLIRRRPAIQLSFAWDTLLQRLIMLRDIDVSGLDEATRKLAYTELQQEYDLLRCQHIPDVLPLIASHYHEDHLYSIAGWPFSMSEEEAVINSRPYTLHDLLQSGIGLPGEQIATSWIAELAQAVERLHEHQIILGELDPDTIIVSSHDYSGRPALMISWLPVAIRHALSQISQTVHPSSFRAPEALYGQEDGLTDIYSLGALLYLLLTGTAPEAKKLSNLKRSRMRSPRVLNSHISRSLDTIVMQALALQPDKRFQRASELREALLDLEKNKQIVRHPLIAFPRPPKSTPRLVEETPVSSDMDNNGSKRSKEAQPIQESDDETIQIKDTQEQLARSYRSRVNTGPLKPQKKSTGEATVDKVQIQDEQVEDDNKYILGDTLKEISKKKDRKSKKGRKTSNRKSRVTNEHALEVANSPKIQDEIVQATAPSVQLGETSLEEALTEAVEEPLIASPNEDTTEAAQVSAKLVEPDRSAEGILQQEVSIDAKQSQELVEVEQEVTMQQEIVKAEIEREEVITEHIVIKEGITPEQEHVEAKEGIVAEEVQEVVEEKILIEQEGIREEISQQQEQMVTGEEAIAELAEAREETIISTSQALVPQSTSRSDMLPVLVPERSKRRAIARIKDLLISMRSLLTLQTQLTQQDASFLQHVQRFILGEQKHTTMAAALIETPMRIQPTQSYAIRIQIIGRDQPKDETQTGGLTALMCGDIVHIEVRLALYQSYAYMIQQADVAMPASGYAAEVTVPMHPLSSGPASRRERLHIFFMDKERNPLYEKPFVIELFVSPLVQLGHEGHNVLSIPI